VLEERNLCRERGKALGKEIAGDPCLMAKQVGCDGWFVEMDL
jgi:hypothetical protein